jgi:hypothetical protein
VSAFHVFDRRFGKARVDAGEQHRLIVSFRAEGERRKCRDQSGASGEMQKTPPVEAAAQQVAAAGAARRMMNIGRHRLQGISAT